MIRSKGRFIGSGWKNMREKRSVLVCFESSEVGLLRQKFALEEEKLTPKASPEVRLRLSSRSTSKKPSPKSHFFAKGSSRKASWKHRKKKSVLDRRSVLKEIITWKHRKKKRSLNTSSKSVLGTKGSLLKRDREWKRKKKRQRSSRKFHYDVFDWDPDIKETSFLPQGVLQRPHLRIDCDWICYSTMSM